MGLYIQTYALRPKLKKWPFRQSLSKQIESESRKWANDYGIGPLFFTYELTPVLSHFTFYPLNESLRFEIDDQRVSIGVKTSSAGAGYHVAFIDLCDHLEKTLKLKWRWKLSGCDGGDETGYAVSRDFSALQDQHLKQAAHILNWCFSEKVLKDMCIHVRPELAHKHEKIAGPRGYIEVIELSEYEVMSSADIEELAKKILTWQDSKVDEIFWLNTLEAILWHEYKWRNAYDEYEHYIESCLNFCIDNLPASGVSKEIQKAIEEYKSTSRGLTEPEIRGIGYRKRRLYTDISDPWRCSIPGYFVASMQDDNATSVFTHGDIVLRGSSMSVDVKDGYDGISWPKYLAGSNEFRRDDFVYRLSEPVSLEGEDEGWLFALGMGITPPNENRVNIVTFSVTATNKDVVIQELETQFDSGIEFKKAKS